MAKLEEVVEVAEVGFHFANKLLAEGYQLLAVEQRTFQAALRGGRGGPDGSPNPYVRKDLVYCIGRMRGSFAERPLKEWVAELSAEQRASQEASARGVMTANGPEKAIR